MSCPPVWHAGTEPRPRDFQHELIVRAVRVVAVQAVFADRRMLEQERSALLGMAFVASVVDVSVFKSASVAAMRVVAIGADDLAFARRMMRLAVHLRAGPYGTGSRCRARTRSSD